MRQLNGSWLWDSEVEMITKRSSHMPMFTGMHTASRPRVVVRMRLKKRKSGLMQLQKTMVQKNGA